MFDEAANLTIRGLAGAEPVPGPSAQFIQRRRPGQEGRRRRGRQDDGGQRSLGQVLPLHEEDVMQQVLQPQRIARL